MRASRFTEEQIIGILREQDAGAKTAEVCRRHGISSTLVTRRWPVTASQPEKGEVADGLHTSGGRFHPERPSPEAGPSPRTGKRISDVRDEGPQSASERSSFPAETANGPLHPPHTAENRGCSAETGNSGLAQDCGVGPGGLEPATRRLSAPASKMVAERTGILLRTER